MAGNKRYLSILLRMLLTFSLLLLLPGTGTAQHREATLNHHEAISIMSRRLGVAFSSSKGRLNSDLGSEPAGVRDLDRFPDKLTNDDTHQGRDLQADDLVKDFESVTRGIVHKNRDAAEVRQTSSNSSRQPQQLCEYTVVIQTGNQDGAGTDSDIRLLLSSKTGEQVYFKNLASGHNTFEKGHKDTFVFPDRPCVTDICQMVLYTDDYGPFSEWFVISLRFKVARILNPTTPSGLILQEKEWWINEWLPKKDDSEELYTIRDDCDSTP